LFYDEFSVSEQNTSYYSWAKRNSRPIVKSNESTRKRVNGLLSIDVLTGKEYLWLTSHAQSDDVARYMAHLAVDMANEGMEQVEILLDKNTTHQNKMQSLFKQEAHKLGLNKQIKFIFTYLPAYSPKLNLVEYAIHLLRQACLHHRPYGMRLADIELKLEQHLTKGAILTPQQVINILQYMEDLVTQNPSSLLV
jgi:transposase